MVYMASVVLIETDDAPPGPALPVLKRRVQAIPFSLSSINSVDPQSVVLAASPPTSINLIGQGLNTDNTVAFMTPGKSEPILAAVGAGATPQLVPVTLPAGLRPGVNSVQLMQTVASPLGSPPASPVLSTSNSMTFVIVPAIVSLSPASPPGTLQAVVFPTVAPNQQVSLVLNQKGGSLAYTLPADPAPRRNRHVQLQHGFPEPDGGCRRTIDGAVGNLSGARSGRLGRKPADRRRIRNIQRTNGDNLTSPAMFQQTSRAMTEGWQSTNQARLAAALEEIKSELRLYAALIAPAGRTFAQAR